MSLLTVNNLTKRYHDHLAVNDVNLQFNSGKCIALIGPNGAGKTTILRILSGLLKPTSGTIVFENMKPTDDIRSLIGYLPQYPVFYSWMTGLEFLIYCGELAHLSKNIAKKRAERLLIKVGIDDAKNKQIGKYSGGMKQRLGIAQAIIHQPKLLILDEPVSSLDPMGRREVLTLIEELKKDMSIIFSTHILTDADEMSDELLLLHQGKIVEAGSMDMLRKKYQTTTIKLAFDGDELKYYQTQINKLDIVTDSFIKHHHLHISTTDVSQARESILTIVTKKRWPLVNFSVNQISLEDMFMKVVRQ